MAHTQEEEKEIWEVIKVSNKFKVKLRSFNEKKKVLRQVISLILFPTNVLPSFIQKLILVPDESQTVHQWKYYCSDPTDMETVLYNQ